MDPSPQISGASKEAEQILGGRRATNAQNRVHKGSEFYFPICDQ